MWTFFVGDDVGSLFVETVGEKGGYESMTAAGVGLSRDAQDGQAGDLMLKGRRGLAERDWCKVSDVGRGRGPAALP